MEIVQQPASKALTVREDVFEARKPYKKVRRERQTDDTVQRERAACAAGVLCSPSESREFPSSLAKGMAPPVHYFMCRSDQC